MFTRTRLAFALPMLILAVSVPQLIAQSQPTASAQAIQFDAVSIHLHPFAGDEPSSRRVLPGGRVAITNTNLRTLIRIAFGMDDNQIVYAPRWIDSEAFDINATLSNHTEISTPQQLQLLILKLLQDRFGFAFHKDAKEGPVYWLELDKNYSAAKLGPALKLSADTATPNMSSNSNGSKSTLSVTHMSMTDIAAGLRRQAGRPVEDHTGLKGTYDFRIEWAPEESPDSTDASLFTVLREQLGLKLVPAKGKTEIVVIDQLNHPSPN